MKCIPRLSFDSLDFDFLWKSFPVIITGIRIEASFVSSIIEYKVKQSVLELLDALLVKLLIINSTEMERDFEFELVVNLFHNNNDSRGIIRNGQAPQSA